MAFDGLVDGGLRGFRRGPARRETTDTYHRLRPTIAFEQDVAEEQVVEGNKGYRISIFSLQDKHKSRNESWTEE